MITVSKFKERLQGKFEGGNSMSLNWFNIAKEACQAMMANISPKRLTRSSELYGGVVNGVKVYYTPADMLAPKGIYSKLVKLDYEFVPSTVFDDQITIFPSKKIFTKTYLNGGSFLYINNIEDSSGAILFDNMDDTTLITSDMTLSVNTYDYLTGAGSFMGTFDDTLNVVTGLNPEGVVDLTDSLFGTVVLNVSIQDKENIESISVKLMTDSSNYFLLNATTALDYIINGFNFVRMKLVDRVTVGSPTLANITGYEITIVTKTGTSQIIIIDGLSVYNTSPFTVSYVSNNIFIDKTTLIRKPDTTDLGDTIDVDTDEEEDILIYEACRIIVQEGTNDNINSNESQRFDKELSRKYSLYFGKYPSDKKPLSYNYSDSDRYLS